MRLECKWLKAHKEILCKVISAVLMVTMVATVLTGLTAAEQEVNIHENGTVYSRYTVYTDPEKILESQGIVLEEGDEYVFSGFEDGVADLTVMRAFRVEIQADGAVSEVKMASGTVAQALEKAGVTVGEQDLINVSMDQEVFFGMTIVINRVTYTQEDTVESIPYETVHNGTLSTPYSTYVESVAGENGEKVVTTQYRYVDGVLTDSEVINEVITKNPVNRVLDVMEQYYVGGELVQAETSPVQLDENGIPVNYKSKVTGKATAYSALGRPTSLTPGAVAMDLSKYPKGTQLYIVSSDGSYVYGYSVVRDTGAFVHNGSGVLVDCFFNTYEESVQFGAKTVDVYVL